MRTPLRAAFRLALTGGLGLAILSIVATTSRAAAEPEKALPDSTLFFMKARSVVELRESFGQSEFGRMLADPAIKPIKDSMMEKLDAASKDIKAKLGVTISELLSLPQGMATLAVVAKADAKVPVAVLISADAGKNEKVMTDVMVKSTKQAEEAGGKVGTESFKGLTLHIIQAPKQGDGPNVPTVWTNNGSVFHIASDVDALKDVISHAEGRSDSLASVDSFAKTKAKLGTDAPVSWFLDINKAIKLLIKVGQAAQPGGGPAQNVEAILQMTGINGLKAASGTFAFNAGAYDSVSKVYFLSPAPVQGILKMFSMPQVNLRPEPWVPATAASYQSLSWDLDGAYVALNDLVNVLSPGALNMLEQQMVGPNGGAPLSLQNDVFGPLGDRMSLFSEIPKPIKEDAKQRILLGVALEDSKAFTATLSKIISIFGGAPAKREFQGTTIYDFKVDLPPGPNGEDNNPFKDGVASIAIAKDTLFVATDSALLESTLRGGSTPLVDSPGFQAVAKQIPAKSSSLTYAKAEEQARASYEMLKGGQFQKALAANPAAAEFGKAFDMSKIPDFSVFAKYLSSGGGFGLMEDDGVTFTTFTLRKANP